MALPSLTLHDIYETPLQKPEKQVGAVGLQAPSQIPEITGQEEMMLFLD